MYCPACGGREDNAILVVYCVLQERELNDGQNVPCIDSSLFLHMVVVLSPLSLGLIFVASIFRMLFLGPRDFAEGVIRSTNNVDQRVTLLDC